MRVLIACEESQEVCKAFRARGHEAYSCDIQECSGGHPEWHIKNDVRYYLSSRVNPFHGNWFIDFYTQNGERHIFDGKWDLIIAHPPCTYMSAAGACRMYPKAGHRDEARYAKAMQAKEFFFEILYADSPRICIENPRPLKCVGLPKETQRIQPFQFGEPWSKQTYLWLKGLPLLEPTEIVADYKPYVSGFSSRHKGMPEKAGASRSGGAQKVRSKTFHGIARAMAEQWG